MCHLETISSARRAILVAAFLIGSLGGLPTPASAQTGGASADKLEELSEEKKEKFIEFIKAGKDAYSAGNFEKAIPFFERAYEIVPKPELHYRIALCYERSDQPARALEHYRKFLELKPETDKRGAVETTIAQLEKRVEAASVAHLAIKSDPTDARVAVRPASADESEAEKRGRTPLELDVQPGELSIVLEKDGFQRTEQIVEVEAGETYNFSYTLDEVQTERKDAISETDTDAPSQSQAPASPGTSVPVAALVVGGVGALIGGSFYGVGMHCNNNRPQCSRGLYNAAAIGAYSGGAVALGSLGLATFQLVNGSGDATRTAADRGLRLEVRVTTDGLELTGAF